MLTKLSLLIAPLAVVALIALALYGIGWIVDVVRFIGWIKRRTK